jgi:hypothetical protein
MDQLLDYGFGIAMVMGFIGFICLKSRKGAAARRGRNDDEYWADRQEEYDTPVIDGYGSDDLDSGSDDD